MFIHIIIFCSWLCSIADCQRDDYGQPEENDSVERRCTGRNEVWNTCASSCPITCANRNNPPTYCNKMCRIGCDCKHGFMRNRNGICVRPRQCGKKLGPKCIGPNEKWTDCGTSCPITCQNYENPPQACNEMCNPGCFCKQYFIRKGPGECVRPHNC